ncbi:MAG TPA: zinc ribbon domain-containing protein [Symbiobacteriaceae bacterium]|nr:zinc ribbon domain-containing protein [Symbiobacteriaceae bacterium]
MLAGLELARTLGGEVLGSEHPVASAVVYGANTVGWIMALWAMDAKDRASRFNPANYRIWLADTGCPHCGYAHPMGANYCNWCGHPLAAQHGQQGVQP